MGKLKHAPPDWGMLIELGAGRPTEGCMGIGIRIEELRKVYDTPPPMAARGAGFSWGGARAGRKDKKKFEVQALDGISLEIRPGEVFGLLGPNGAGKTTTIAVLTTRVEPTSGRVFVGEHDVWKEQVKAKRLIGVVPQRPNLDFALTAARSCCFTAPTSARAPASASAAPPSCSTSSS